MILTNQRGQVGPSFWGGFTQGIAGSLERQNERKRQKQAMDLQKKRFDLEEKEFAFKEGELKRRLLEHTRQQQAEESVFAALTRPDQTAPTVETEPGDVPIGAVPEDPKARQRELYGALFRAQPKEMTQALMRQQTGQTTTRPSVVGNRFLVDPTGKVVFEAPEQAPRTGVGAESQMFEIQKKMAQGTATPQEATLFNAWKGTLKELSQARSEGTTAGRPIEGTTATQLNILDNLLNETVANIRKNYASGKYLGPIQGSDIGFAARRQIGSSIGMPVGTEETTFRTALQDASDQLLRARSGAQINEQEYGRLRAILPKATDEPQVFLAALDRFEGELRSLLEKKRRMAVTPRGQMGSGTPAGQRGRFNPETGRIEF